MSTFHEISSYFGAAVQASVDDKVAVYLASMRLAGRQTAVVADNDSTAGVCHLTDCICVMSRPRPWSSSTNSVGVRHVLEDDESSSSYTNSDEHDFSASRRHVNTAWNPNEENVRFPSRPQTFYSTHEQIPAYWLQIMPTPQPSVSQEEESASEEVVDTPALDAVLPLTMPRPARKPANALYQYDIDDPNEIEFPDDIAYMTTAVFTPTENAATPLPQDGDNNLEQQKRPSIWKRLSSRKRAVVDTDQPSSPTKSEGWRIKMRFIGRLLRHRA